MTTSAYPEPAPWRETPIPHHATWWSSVTAEAAIEFGRFRVLLRWWQLLADGIPVELSTRAFDLLLVLLEADGSLVTKNELLRRVWPRIGVAEENLKVQMCALRKALGEDRDFIRTEFGRGYRFAATVRWRCKPIVGSRTGVARRTRCVAGDAAFSLLQTPIRSHRQCCVQPIPRHSDIRRAGRREGPSALNLSPARELTTDTARATDGREIYVEGGCDD